MSKYMDFFITVFLLLTSNLFSLQLEIHKSGWTICDNNFQRLLGLVLWPDT